MSKRISKRISKSVLFISLIAVSIIALVIFAGCKITRPLVTAKETVQTTPLTVQNKLLTVSGTGKVIASPDEVTVMAGVETKSETAQEAMDTNSKIMKELIDAVKNFGIDEKDIATVGVNIYPDYYYPQDGGPSQIVGYSAWNQVNIKTKEIDKVGELIAILTESGATSISGVEFRLSEDNQANIDALNLAYDNAMAKANSLASKMGVEIVGVYSATESGAVTPPQPVSYAMEKAIGGEGEVAPPPIQPQHIEVISYISVSYLIK
ncbi:MAG: SIMPL domain-containing protein [Actinobacteria bacterium]|nr:SIMPL domain-containing protein [Actinomycetota bacterium]